jgi:hypothetical protein
MLKVIHRPITLSLVFLFVSSPLLAQQRRSASPKKPATAAAAEPVRTFDTLLSADSYKVYCEVRGVGGLIRSSAVNDLLDPVMKLGAPPKEFKTMVKWLKAHADVLAGSRMLVAGWPSRPNLPTVLVAIEFSSAEEAKKFYPELSAFLPTLLPTPTPTPMPTPTPTPSPASTSAPAPKPTPFVSGGPTGTRIIVAEPVLVPLVSEKQEPRPIPEKELEPALPPYQMQLAGSLILISPTPFTFRNLRPRDSKLLGEDQNFLLARNRFASESIFLYVDVKSIEKEEKDQRQKWEEEEQKRIEAEAAKPPKVEEPVEITEPEMQEATVDEQLPPPSEPEPSASLQSPVVAIEQDSPASGNAALSGSPQGTDEIGPMFVSMYSALFGGDSKWPEAVAAALVFEGDAYVLRTLILNGEDNKNSAIPFAPQFVSGPAFVPESPNIFPVDTDLFISVSLDYPQVYEGMVKAIAHAEEQSRKYSTQTVKVGPPPESPFALYEKKLGLKIKDDLLPLLGNELALALPKRTPIASTATPANPGPQGPAPEKGESTIAKTAEPNPVIAIAVKDREAVGRLIPKIIESFGLKGANLFAQTEKRDGTEITSYGNVFAYAFVGDFLVVSPDAAATQHVVDAYLNHETLSANSHFKNFTRWQPRQVLGQVYVGPELMETYNPLGRGLNGPVNLKTNDFLSRLSPLIEPTTYALSNDGSGPLHELHIPRNLLLWMIGSSLVVAEAAPLQANESAAQGLLRTVHSAEATFQATEGNGHYGTLDELVSTSLISKQSIQQYGYRIEVTVSGNKFEATAAPNEYGVTGTLSYFIDESGVLRAGDHGGGVATVADQPIN